MTNPKLSKKFKLMLTSALIVAIPPLLALHASAQTTKERKPPMNQPMSAAAQTLQARLVHDFMPKNNHEVARRRVFVDKESAELTRYVRTDGRNNVIGGEHFSTVIDANGKLKGFTRMDADLLGRPLPTPEEAQQIAMSFLQQYAPDLLNNFSMHFVAKHDEPILVRHGNSTTTQKLAGMKVKMRNKNDGLYFWVIVGADHQVMTFERDVYWANLPYGHRRTEQWLHDTWLKDQQKINQVADI